MSAYESILLETDGPLGLLTLNKAARHNAFDADLIAEITLGLLELEEEASVRIVVLSALGTSFCTGADLAWMQKAAHYSFEENRRDAEQLRIVVAEGTVRLQSEHELASSGGALLPAGSVVRIEGRNELVQQLEIAEVERLLRWRDGVLAFRDVKLREAVAEFNRYNRRRIVIEDAAVGELPIGGHFRFDNVETFVRLIERGFPVRAEFLADRIILRAP